MLRQNADKGGGGQNIQKYCGHHLWKLPLGESNSVQRIVHRIIGGWIAKQTDVVVTRRRRMVAMADMAAVVP